MQCSQALGWIAAFAMLVACGDDDASARDAGAPIDAELPDDVGSGDGATADARPADAGTVRVAGDYFDFFRGFAPVVGGEVCIIGPDAPLCTLTDDQGEWVLDGVPALSQRELRYVAPGYLTSYRFITTRHRDLMLYRFAIASDDLVGVLSMALDVEIDPRLGIVVFESTSASVTSVSHQDVSGVTVRLRSVATGGDIHPDGIYANPMQVLVRSLDATSDAGWGVFVNVQPGEYLATFTHATRTCVAHPEIAWAPDDGANATVRIAVHADATAHATAFCPE